MKVKSAPQFCARSWGLQFCSPLTFKDPDLSAENSRGYFLKLVRIVGHESIILMILHENVSSKIEAFGV